MNSPSEVTRDTSSSEKYQKSIPKKRKLCFDPETSERDECSFSASMKMQEKNVVPLDSSIQYRILNFITVFSTIATFVKCKTCDSDIKFQTQYMQGLGFKIALICDNCGVRLVPSCPYIGHSYEINKRFIFTMRVLGLGFEGCEKFCGLMDIPNYLSRSMYDLLVESIHTCVLFVCNKLFAKAVNEEVQRTSNLARIENYRSLTVSVGGTWKKRGFTSLYGVASIIGYYTGKVLDVAVKSAYCKICEVWEKKKGTAEYEDWQERHGPNCTVNHQGSSGEMEVNAVVEMFKRSETLHCMKYLNYVGDGDSETYNSILNSAPYDDIIVNKKECIDHLQKRMVSRLCECKKEYEELGGRGNLTGQMIDDLTFYYGLAIRQHCNSIEEMEYAIWAPYYHYSSTNENPQHQYCPAGTESWCQWKRAYRQLRDKSKIEDFLHDYDALSADVLEAIKPIYEDFSKEELLERCLGAYTQNNNENYNQLVWEISPEITPSSSIIVELAAYIAVCTFNEGFIALLQIMKFMGISCGPYVHAYVRIKDNERGPRAEGRTQENTREARERRRE